MTDDAQHHRTPHQTVLHDPLIDRAGTTPPAAPVRSRGGRSIERRGKHPALSARILATGLATTGTLGLTAGYAFSAPAKSSPAPTTDTTHTTGSPATPGPEAAQGPAAQIPAQQTPAKQTPGTTGAPVVVLEVPPIEPATPGSSAGSGWTNTPDPGTQQSSGSN